MFARNHDAPPPSHLWKFQAWRNVAMLLTGFPAALARDQVSTKRHRLFADLMIDARMQLPLALLPLERLLAGRRIVVELESGGLSAAKEASRRAMAAAFAMRVTEPAMLHKT
jgi:hypothetical protein